VLIPRRFLRASGQKSKRALLEGFSPLCSFVSFVVKVLGFPDLRLSSKSAAKGFWIRVASR
jgi:hypothetical protein